MHPHPIQAELSKDMRRMLDTWDAATRELRRRKSRWGSSRDEVVKDIQAMQVNE